MKRVIGVELGVRRVRAVQLIRAGGGWRVERAAERAVERDATVLLAAERGATVPVAIALGSLLREGGFRSAAPVALSMPPGAVFFQTLETDLVRLEDVRRVLKFETEADFPFPPRDLVVDICSARPLPDGRQAVLVVVVSREALETVQRAVREAGFRCVRVDSAACALHGLACRSDPALARERIMSLRLSEDEALLTIGDEGRLAGVRSFPLPRGPQDAALEEIVREMELSWRETFGAAPPPATRCLLSGDADRLAGLSDGLKKAAGLVCGTAALGCDAVAAEAGAAPAIELAAAPSEVERAVRADESYAAALGIAIEAAVPLGVPPNGTGANFLAAEAALSGAGHGARRGLIVAAVLAVAVAAVWSAGALSSLRALNRGRAALRTQTAAIARELFPSDPTAARESPQDVLNRAQDLLKQEKTDAAALLPLAGPLPLPLQALECIDARAPSAIHVKISELSVADRLVRIGGATDSYDSFEQLKKQFEAAPEFRNLVFTSSPAGSPAGLPAGLPAGAGAGAGAGRNAQTVPFVATFSFEPAPKAAVDQSDQSDRTDRTVAPTHKAAAPPATAGPQKPSGFKPIRARPLPSGAAPPAGSGAKP